MKKRYLIIILFLVACCSFFGMKIVVNKFIDVNSNKYSSSLIDGFERDIYGSTGWAAINLSLKESASDSSQTLATVIAGQPFMILEESGSYWKIEYSNKIGYVKHDYCMINLPDVIPSIVYDIKNSYSSIYRTRDNNGVIDIPNVTGKVFYGKNCNNGICEKISDDGKVMNYKIGKNQYIVPSLYSTAKKIGKAQSLAMADGYSLLINDSYRPFSTSEYVASKFNDLFDSNAEVREHVLHSYGANTGTQYEWTKTYFISQVNRGSHISAHNVGAAIDTSICQNVSISGVRACAPINMFTDMHQLSTDSIKYYSKDVEKIPANYSGSMLNSENARRLDGYMIDSNVSMTTLASEWWHFEDSEGRTRLTQATNTEGCDFQVTRIVSRPEFFSSYAPDSLLTTIGDVNADGNIDSQDAELVYQLQNYFKTKGCDTCDKLLNYSDYSGDNNVDLADVYAILNKDDDLVILPSGVSFIDSDNIYTHTNLSPNITVKNINNLSGSIQNNKYVVTYNDEVIKEFNLVSVSSSYNLEGNSISVSEPNISSFLSNFTCNNCSVFVNNGTTDLSSGNFNSNYSFVIKNGNDVIRSYSLIHPITGISFDENSISLDVSDTYQLVYAITPLYGTNKNVTFVSSDPNVVSVDVNGLVTANSSGSATITVTTVDGSYSDVCTIDVGNIIKYTVTYRDGSNDTTREYREGESIDLSGLSKTGFIFNGWKYNGNTYSLNDNLVMPSTNIILIADWTPIIPEIENYSVSNDVVYNVSINTSVSNFDLGLDPIYSFKLYDKNNNLKEDGVLATGDKVSIFVNDDKIVDYKISVRGDVNGDGIVSPVDFYELYELRKRISNSQDVNLIYKLAGDLNNDGTISPVDIFNLYDLKKGLSN
jgi:D-alanyl-D-alanine dipeptidase